MTEEFDVKKRIMAKAEEMFTEFGYSRVTVDEIAAGLGISKKTLYKHFSGKEQILKEVIENRKCTNMSYITEIINNETMEFSEKLQRLMEYLKEMSKTMHSPLISDLVKNYPDIYNDIQNFKREKAIHQVEKLMLQGANEGVFRKDINLEVFMMIFVASIREATTPSVLSNLPQSPGQVFNTILKVIFEGLLTEEGRIVVREKEKREETSNVN